MAVTFGKLEIDPRVNPAVLDTATWDPATDSKLAARYSHKDLRGKAQCKLYFTPQDANLSIENHDHDYVNVQQ